MDSLHKPTILVTGGAGFIGSNFVNDWLALHDGVVVNIDKLTYAGSRVNLQDHDNNPNHIFIKGDIGDCALVAKILKRYQPLLVVNFAAESHVDRSISDPDQFIHTNIVGTYNFIKELYAYWSSLASKQKKTFRFLHVSTDEVYGSLTHSAPAFVETNSYAPNSPYSASKAAGDHLVRAFYQTYQLPAIISHSSNNFGPYQFPEKLIPLTIMNAIQGKPIGLYGDGANVRDWIYVKDHCAALRAILASGENGEHYNIGANQEKTNLDVVEAICSCLDNIYPDVGYYPHRTLIKFITDRPGHDRRYALNTEKIAKVTEWKPDEPFDSAISKTIKWYLNNQKWLNDITGSVSEVLP